MTEIDKLLAENLIEALRQIQSYLVLGLGSSGSALALAVALLRFEKRRSKPSPEPSPNQALAPESELPDVEVPGIPVRVRPVVAELVFLVLTCVAGLMAYYSALNAIGIASRLRSVPGLLEAAATFPCVATSPYLAVRFLPVLLPPVLAGVAAWLELRRENAAPTALWVWLVLIIAPYFFLGLALHRPGWAL
jgi:hypothetical protein